VARLGRRSQWFGPYRDAGPEGVLQTGRAGLIPQRARLHRVEQPLLEVGTELLEHIHHEPGLGLADELDESV
jgi:hypothetical protein